MIEIIRCNLSWKWEFVVLIRETFIYRLCVLCATNPRIQYPLLICMQLSDKLFVSFGGDFSCVCLFGCRFMYAKCVQFGWTNIEFQSFHRTIMWIFVLGSQFYGRPLHSLNNFTNPMYLYINIAKRSLFVLRIEFQTVAFVSFIHWSRNGALSKSLPTHTHTHIHEQSRCVHRKTKTRIRIDASSSTSGESEFIVLINRQQNG